MDDPYILAFRFMGVSVWHKDPRTPNHPDPGWNGDTAGWTYPRLNAKEVAYAEYIAGKNNADDNLASWFPDIDYEFRAWRIKQIFRSHKKVARPWWRHPRYQFWNWRIL
jgi:hypothetical protein